MKKKIVSLLFISLVMAALTGCSEAGADPSQESMTDLNDIEAEELTADLDTAITFDAQITSYEAVQNFSYNLFKHNLDELNPVLSPVSAYLALAMAGNGAEGETLNEFYDLLGNNINSMPYELITNLSRETEGMTISLANSAWVDDTLHPSEKYLTVIDSYFDAEVYKRELASAQAMEDMNLWVNAKTNGLIPVMLEEPLDEDSRLVLFNTIYFNGDWESPFKGYSTVMRDFNISYDEIVKVDMMQMYGENQLYINNEFVDGVILPYKDDNIVFMALKPADDNTVRDIYDQLTWEDISGFLKLEEERPCNLQLPKFEVEFSKELNDCLKEMGLVKAFDSSQADLSGIGTTEQGGNFYISLVKQKSKIIVDEEGTEASAATMVEVKEESAIEYENPPVDIFFNEPFLYMIIDKEKEVPLFMGIMDNPQFHQ